MSNGEVHRAPDEVSAAVVIGLITLLVGILLPALAQARHASRLVQCAARQRQLGVAIHTYAGDHDGHLPIGPNTPHPAPYDTSFKLDEIALNQLWVAPRGPSSDYPEGTLTGHGVLLNTYLADNRAAMCPDPNDPEVFAQNLDAIESFSEDGNSNYLYRNLDQTSGVRVDDLGHNDAGGRAVALAFDLNQRLPAGLAGPEPFVSLNHAGRAINNLYHDGSSHRYRNTNDRFTLREQDYVGFPDFTALSQRLDTVLVRLDHGYVGDPADAPTP